MDRSPRTGWLDGAEPTRLELAGSVSPGWATRALGWAVAGLTLLSIASQAARSLLADFPGRDLLASVFGLDSEWNVPTIYSALLLLASAALLEFIGRIERVKGLPSARHWRLLALIFVGLALDELLGFHELLNDRLDLGAVSSITLFPWVLVGGAFAAAVAAAFRGFLARLPVGTRRQFLLAGTVFLAGSLGLEAVGGRLSQLYGQGSLAYLATADLEEILEMVGILVFIRALLAHLGSVARVITVELRTGDRHEAAVRHDHGVTAEAAAWTRPPSHGKEMVP